MAASDHKILSLEHFILFPLYEVDKSGINPEIGWWSVLGSAVSRPSLLTPLHRLLESMNIYRDYINFSVTKQMSVVSLVSPEGASQESGPDARCGLVHHHGDFFPSSIREEAPPGPSTSSHMQHYCVLYYYGLLCALILIIECWVSIGVTTCHFV